MVAFSKQPEQSWLHKAPNVLKQTKKKEHDWPTVKESLNIRLLEDDQFLFLQCIYYQYGCILHLVLVIKKKSHTKLAISAYLFALVV